MQGGNAIDATKVGRRARLAAALARHPRDVPAYARLGRRRGEATLELGLPWFSFAAIRFLEKRLTGAELVYEYGGGGSTVFFARRARWVVTVEHSARWLEQIDNRLSAAGLTNVQLIHADADFDDVQGFGDSAFARALPAAPADLVVLDSYDVTPPHRLRPQLFPQAEARVRPGGVVVVDDSWRYKQLRSQSSARAVRTEFGTGPARVTATTTDFYLY